METQDKDFRKDHRERVRQRIDKNGIKSLSDYEVLEYILFQCIPYKDTKPMAHALIDRFGSLSSVFGAGLDELQKIVGIGLSTAHFLHNLKPIVEIYNAQKERPSVVLSADGIIPFVKNLIKSKKDTVECIYILYLTERQLLLEVERIAEGGINRVEVPIHAIYNSAQRLKSQKIIIVHNHLSENASPSSKDIASTYNITSAFRLMGLTVLDHIIVAGKGAKAFSFFLQGVL